MPYGVGMTVFTRRPSAGSSVHAVPGLIMTVTGLVTISALLLCGCVSTPVPRPSVQATAPGPIFASNEEALRAATEAYSGYNEMSDRILREGGAGPDRIREFTSKEMAEIEIESYTNLAAEGRRMTGETSFSNVTLQSVVDGTVSVYVCSDLSQVEMLDSRGISTVPAGRADRFPTVVSLSRIALLRADSSSPR